MNTLLTDSILETARKINEFALTSDSLSYPGNGLIDRSEIIKITERLRSLLFPGYFDIPSPLKNGYASGYELTQIAKALEKQCLIALKMRYSDAEAQEKTEKILLAFINKLPEIQMTLATDVDALFTGDPAAFSKIDVIISYPGLIAITIYRIAHVLYEEKLPLIPRIMTEYAHSLTGIDINAGAKIGKYFFIDHGTGVVIGETTEIGDYVKLYQGVTLGALSTRKGHMLSGSKRHPTLGNRVTVYSGASILGGDTVIGDDCIIGGNAFVTSSVPSGTRVSVKRPELTFRDMNGGVWETPGK